LLCSKSRGKDWAAKWVLESVLAIFGVKPGVLTMKGIGTLIIKIENQNDNFPSIILREISAQIRFRQGTD
jgi:hypothetical protein